METLMHLFLAVCAIASAIVSVVVSRKFSERFVGRLSWNLAMPIPRKRRRNHKALFTLAVAVIALPVFCIVVFTASATLHAIALAIGAGMFFGVCWGYWLTR